MSTTTFLLPAVLSLSLLACGTSSTREPTFPHQEECGNPALESNYFLVVEGRAVEVTSPRSFVLVEANGRTVNVTLANVGEPFHATTQDVLRSWLEGEDVTVLVQPSAWRNSDVVAVVEVRRYPDLSHRLIRTGLAAFVEAPAYTQSHYGECLNRIAEREAKAERVGIWAEKAGDR